MRPQNVRVLRPIPSPRFPEREGNGLLASFVHAWNGLIHTVAYQRNMRIHLVCAVLVGLVGSGIPLGLAEKVTMIFCVILIFFAEILNSALEQLVDLATEQLNERARIAKDAAAAGVLVLAVGTVVVFAAVLVHNWDTVASHVGEVRRQFVLGIPLATLTALLIMDRRKPIVFDALLLVGALALFVATAVASTSYVFSAMTLGLLVVSATAAWVRRQQRARSSERGRAV